ncbi:MAG: MBL fold metallo-hydrolase, partial [Sulfuriferula sp.]
DMSLIPRFHKVDVMLACIGDHYTMGPERAAMATKLVNPSMVIPMHYGTFPVLTGTPAEFKSALTAQRVKAKLVVMRPDEMIKL